MSDAETFDAPLPVLVNRYEWQINRRYRVQQFLNVLYQFLETHTEFHREGDDEWHQMLRMTDIAFSLWRSAFLTNVARDRSKIYDHTKEFLQKVVEQNAITFADDYKMCEMSVGYYNNNARYRLERMYEFNTALLGLPKVQRVADLRKATNIATMKQADLWDIYYEAACDCLRYFKNHWDENVRPRRPSKVASKAAPTTSGDDSIDGPQQPHPAR